MRNTRPLRILAVEQRTDVIGQQVNAIEQQIDSIEGQVDTILGTVELLATTVERSKDALAAIGQRIVMLAPEVVAQVRRLQQRDANMTAKLEYYSERRVWGGLEGYLRQCREALYLAHERNQGRLTMLTLIGSSEVQT